MLWLNHNIQTGLCIFPSTPAPEQAPYASPTPAGPTPTDHYQYHTTQSIGTSAQYPAQTTKTHPNCDKDQPPAQNRSVSPHPPNTAHYTPTNPHEYDHESAPAQYCAACTQNARAPPSVQESRR